MMNELSKLRLKRNYIFKSLLFLIAGVSYIGCTKNSNTTTTTPITGNTVGNIYTVAGGGTGTKDSGDGGLAIYARLREAVAVCIDANGNLFIAEGLQHSIRKVNANGIISTYADTSGTSGFIGDGGLAISAKLNNPTGVCTDAAGNLFIADENNNRVRQISSSGIISTFAGNGTTSGSTNGDGGQAINALLGSPHGVFTDTSGNLFIAEYSNNRIRKVSKYGIITTVAGNGSFGFSGDSSLATAAKIKGPYGVFVDAYGNLFIADWLNKRVRKVDTKGIITTVAGKGGNTYSGDGGKAIDAGLDPVAVCTDPAGNLYIADWINSRVRKVDTNGVITTVAGGGALTANYGDGGPATSASVVIPTSVCVDASGTNLYISSGSRIRKVVLK